MRAGRREWIGLAVLALPCLVYSMDLTVLYMAVPELAADLHPSSVRLLWITDIYGFMLAGHGLYCWGKDLTEARRHSEALEFLLEAIGRAGGR